MAGHLATMDGARKAGQGNGLSGISGLTLKRHDGGVLCEFVEKRLWLSLLMLVGKSRNAVLSLGIGERR